ncbi:putative Late nodulin [Medicago truncatula]|uniref:Nodule-specific cysteine-rich peptide 239 n=1 Tax=Medicago truncatula TaxID=3880 RepID=A7KHC6_MEDTR|nr:nodule-specific cysteine-rich peptide 239 [Medicago truncatula]RHN38384.1 putative Late nodulin [Medicago truncatula]RHN46601.1 putative Late nodulin [Medicago truncatula]
MQMKKMATILKFVYLIILLIYPLLVVTEESHYMKFSICKDDTDCPTLFCVLPNVPKCIGSKCHCKLMVN